MGVVGIVPKKRGPPAFSALDEFLLPILWQPGKSHSEFPDQPEEPSAVPPAAASVLRSYQNSPNGAVP